MPPKSTPAAAGCFISLPCPVELASPLLPRASWACHSLTDCSRVFVCVLPLLLIGAHKSLESSTRGWCMYVSVLRAAGGFFHLGYSGRTAKSRLTLQIFRWGGCLMKWIFFIICIGSEHKKTLPELPKNDATTHYLRRGKSRLLYEKPFCLLKEHVSRTTSFFSLSFYLSSSLSLHMLFLSSYLVSEDTRELSPWLFVQLPFQATYAIRGDCQLSGMIIAPWPWEAVKALPWLFPAHTRIQTHTHTCTHTNTKIRKHTHNLNARVYFDHSWWVNWMIIRCIWIRVQFRSHISVWTPPL